MAIKYLGKNERKFLSEYFEGALVALHPSEGTPEAAAYAAGTLSFKFFAAAVKAKTGSVKEVEQIIAKLSSAITDAKKVPGMEPSLARLAIIEAFTYAIVDENKRSSLGSYSESMFFPEMVYHPKAMKIA